MHIQRITQFLHMVLIIAMVGSLLTPLAQANSVPAVSTLDLDLTGFKNLSGLVAGLTSEGNL